MSIDYMIINRKSEDVYAMNYVAESFGTLEHEGVEIAKMVDKMVDALIRMKLRLTVTQLSKICENQKPFYSITLETLADDNA